MLDSSGGPNTPKRITSPPQPSIAPLEPQQSAPTKGNRRRRLSSWSSKIRRSADGGNGGEASAAEGGEEEVKAPPSRVLMRIPSFTRRDDEDDADQNNKNKSAGDNNRNNNNNILDQFGGSNIASSSSSLLNNIDTHRLISTTSHFNVTNEGKGKQRQQESQTGRFQTVPESILSPLLSSSLAQQKRAEVVLEVTVEDSGAGMDPNKVEDLFRPYAQTASATQEYPSSASPSRSLRSHHSSSFIYFD